MGKKRNETFIVSHLVDEKSKFVFFSFFFVLENLFGTFPPPVRQHAVDVVECGEYVWPGKQSTNTIMRNVDEISISIGRRIIIEIIEVCYTQASATKSDIYSINGSKLESEIDSTYSPTLSLSLSTFFTSFTIHAAQQ